MKDINADNARALADAYISQSSTILGLDEKIQRAAANGKHHHSEDLQHLTSYNVRNAVANQVTTEYEARGFKVKRITGDDQREGDSWDYMQISW